MCFTSKKYHETSDPDVMCAPTLFRIYFQKSDRSRKPHSIWQRPWQGALFCTFWPLPSLFVRDGILSVADYNSTLMGVVVVVVVVVVYLFHDGITRERLELSSWFFAWWLVMTICFESEFGSQFHSCSICTSHNLYFLGKNFTMG